MFVLSVIGRESEVLATLRPRVVCHKADDLRECRDV